MKIHIQVIFLFSGGSMVSEINKRDLHYQQTISTFEVASSGTKNISVRNPVYDLSLIHRFGKEKYRIEQKLQTGFSKKILALSELENGISDSISNDTKGMYFELENKYFKKDSTLFLTVGYRYVDPNFRSAGAQTRRLDYTNGNKTLFIQFIPICL